MILTLPDITPSYTSAPDTTFQVSIARLGDGYTQRVPIGLNSTKRTWRVVWNDGDIPEMETLAAFFRTAGGYQAFLWTPPGDETPTKWICSGFKGPTRIEGGLLANLSATFEEVFDR